MYHVLKLDSSHHQLNVFHVPREILNNLLIVELDLVNLLLQNAHLTFCVIVAGADISVEPVENVSQLSHAFDDVVVAATEKSLRCFSDVLNDSILVLDATH